MDRVRHFVAHWIKWLGYRLDPELCAICLNDDRVCCIDEDLEARRLEIHRQGFAMLDAYGRAMPDMEMPQ